MKHNRLLYAFCALFFFTMTPQIIMAGAEVAELGEDAAMLGKDVNGITVKSEEAAADLEKLQQDLREAVGKNDFKEVDRLMKENAGKFKFPEGMENRVASAQAVAEKVVEQAGATADKALIDAGKDAAKGASGAAETNPLLKDIKTDDPVAARDQYSKVAQTKNLVEKVEGKLGDVAAKTNDALEEYATRFKSADRDIGGFAKKYQVDLSNIPENAIDTLGLLSGKTNEEMATEIKNIKEDLASGDPAKVKAAGLKVARLKALSGVGDLEGVMSDFAAKGAIPDMATDMLTKTIDRVSASFTDLEKALKDSDFFEETVSKDAEGVETKSSKFDKFLKNSESSLTGAIKNDATKYITECDSASIKLAKDGNISTFEGMRLRARAFLRNPLDVMGESFDSFATDLKTTSRYDVADSFVDAGKGIKDGVKSIGAKLAGAAEMLVSAVVFMVPNIFQSAFLAQKQKAAAMASWANPIKYGGKVYQIPDSCINIGSPASSWPVYVQIPVNNVGETIGSALSTLYNGAISGPTTNNAMAAAIHSASAQIFSFGTNADTTINRYKITESDYFPLTDISVVYGGPGAYVTTGSIAMNSSQFTGQVISLRTGDVTDATGDVVNATGLDSVRGVPLIPVTAWGSLAVPQTSPISQGLQAVNQVLPAILAKEEVAGSKQTYTQYSDVGSGSSGTQITANIQDLFDTDCVSSNGSLKNADCGAVIVDGLEALSAGLTIDASGDVGTVFHMSTAKSQQFLNISVTHTPIVHEAAAKIGGAIPTAIPVAGNKSKQLGRLAAPGTTQDAAAPAASSAWTGLGSVIPVFGWGGPNDSTPLYSTIINSSNFPDFDPTKVQGITAISETGKIGKDNLVQHAAKPVVGDENMQFASQDTLWVAQGCWMYLSTNTPFTQYITQGISTPQSLHGPYVDYIVFLDDTVNIVPMMVPVTVEIDYAGDAGTDETYKKVQMYLNPAIKYWASLIAYNLDQFMEPDSTGTAQPIMYDLAGNVYPYPGLSSAIYVAPSSSSGAGGFLGAVANSFPDFHNQFHLHRAALLARVDTMPIPYANCSLSPSATYTVNGATAYTGMNCFESSEDDLLLPFNLYPLTTKGVQPETLPNSEAQYLISLVTDIAYQIQPDNSWTPIDFTNSILQLDANNQPLKAADGTYEVDVANESQFYTLSGLYGSTAIPSDLQDYVTAQRAAWIANMGATLEIGTGSNAITCSLASGLSQKYVQGSKAFIYELTPSPSAAFMTQQDFFVVVNSKTPTLSTLKPVTLAQANSSATLVSLVTGTLYDMNGNPLTHKNGLSQRVKVGSLAKGTTSTQAIYNHITETLFTSLPEAFATQYEASVKQYIAAQVLPMGPYSFGSVSVAIRSGDVANGTYVYYSAAGMHKSDFMPRDLYVILTPNAATNGYDVSQYDATQTQYLLSLLTGVAYDQNGQIAMTLPPANLATMISGWSVGWSPWVLSTLKSLQALYKERQARYAADEQTVEDNLNKFISEHDAALNKDKAAIAAIIKNLKPAGAGLPIPFSSLQYDSKTGNYVHPSPASATDDKALIYLFLGTGKVYHSDGTYVTQYQPAHLKAVCDQYGFVVDAKTGKQKLGIPMMQPSLLMDPKDEALTVTTTGDSLINANSTDFPGETVKMATGYGLFFSKIMDTYYVLNSETDQWMSVDGGHIYEKNGAPVVLGNSVAVATKKTGALAAADDLILLYANDEGFMQGFMSDGSEYSNTTQSNSPATWMGLAAPYNELSVTANTKLTQYVIGKTTYKVDTSAAWHSLVLVPITSQGTLLKDIPDSSYRFVQMVTDGNQLSHLLFNGVMYKVASSKGADYTMVSVNAAAKGKAASIEVTTNLFDEDTRAPYITIEDDKDMYFYAYEPQSFDAAEQEANRVNIFGGVTAASSLPLPIGPMHTATKKVGEQTITVEVPDYTSYVLFASDLPATSGAVIAPTSVVIKSIVGAPVAKTDPTEYALLEMGIQNVSKTKDGRYLCAIGGSSVTNAAGTMSFSYISKPAYVDLETAAVYDQVTGLALGQCLNLHDYLYVLDQCRVMVSKNKAGKNQLTYRSAAKAGSQAQQIQTNTATA